jgi:hypothetical protein
MRRDVRGVIGTGVDSGVVGGAAGVGGRFLSDNISDSHQSESSSGFTHYLPDLISEAKSKLQVTGDYTKRNGVTYALFGSSGSGKSTIIRKIFLDDLYNNERQGVPMNDEYIVTLFTESKHADALQNLDEDGVLVDACGLNEEVYKWMYAMNYTYDKQYNFVVMIDDVLTVKSLPTVFKAFLTYRNMNITSVVSLQYLKLCPLAVRSSLYFCFLLPLNSNEGIEQLVKGYLGMYLPGKSLGVKINRYKDMCKDHCFFLMDNLNHRCFYVNADYMAKEMLPLPAEEWLSNSSTGSSGSSNMEEKDNVYSSLPPSFDYGEKLMGGLSSDRHEERGNFSSDKGVIPVLKRRKIG